MVTKAPFETFGDHYTRSISEEPFNDAFLDECRKAALRYDKDDIFLRGIRLSDLQKAVPLHFRGKVFDGMSFVFVE
jgi:hypothetical protein